MEAEASMEGAQGAAWLIPEPHPGHVLVQRLEAVDGVFWFLLSVDIDPYRLVLRGVDPGHTPEDGIDLVLIEEPLVVVEVPDGVEVGDFVQLPGELAAAVIRDVIVPGAAFVVQWTSAVARLLGRLRNARKVKRTRAEVQKERTATKLINQRRTDARRRRKKRKG